MGLMSPQGKSRDERPLSTTFVSRAGLTSAMRSMSTSYRRAVGRGDQPAKSEAPLPSPPSSPALKQPQKRPVSTADILYMHEGLHAEVTVIQRATRVPIVSLSQGNLREVVYHDGRPTYQ